MLQLQSCGRSVLGVLALALTTGCGTVSAYSAKHRLGSGAELPSLQLDVAASSIDLIIQGDPIGSLPTWATPEALRRDVADALIGLKSTGGASAEAPAARFVLTGEVTASELPTFFPCFIYFTFYGCPASRARAQLTLKLQMLGQVFVSSGDGSAWSSLYYNDYLLSKGQRPAIARALHQAVLRMTNQLRANGLLR